MDAAPTMTLVAGPNILTAPALATPPPLAPAVAIFVKQGCTRLTDVTDPFRIADKYECTGPGPAHMGLQQCLSWVFGCSSGFRTDSVVGLAAATAEIREAGQCKPVNKAENNWRRQHGHLLSTDKRHTSVSSLFYHPRTAARNLYPLPAGDSSSVTDAMGTIWSMDLAKKYLHLSWALLNELFEVEALTALHVVLWALAALRILGPEVAQQALNFIADGTIHPTQVDKILLDGEPLSPTVDAICRTVEHTSHNAQPTAVVATLPSTTTTGAQMLVAIVQQQPVAAGKSPAKVANAFGEMLRAVNDDVSIIEVSPFPMATALQSLKIGILREVHLCGGLVIDFPSEELILSVDKDEE
uniref:Uncharacterized protein n=1 Tax=Romanomermis culicivorax TaxID=13658 RepID=A0A915JMH5_ROMCU